MSEATLPVPAYLEEVYWWAYVHPRAVRLFERQWLVNAILFGNFSRLRDAALAELDPSAARTLQIACVYGDFSSRVAGRLLPGRTLDVVDVLRVQLRNLRGKLGINNARVRTFQRNSAALGFEADSYDQAILFFLLHEQPEDVRRQTLSEALRVVKPGGRLVIVDYHQPGRWHPLRYLFRPILKVLEPFAMDLWNHPVEAWLPEDFEASSITRKTLFGGLYQKIVITR